MVEIRGHDQHIQLRMTRFDLIDKRGEGVSTLKHELKDPAIQSWISKSIFGDEFDFYNDAATLVMPDIMKAEWDSNVAQSCVRNSRWKSSKVFRITVEPIVKTEEESVGVTPAPAGTVGSGVTPAPSGVPEPTLGTGSGVTPAPAPTVGRPCPYRDVRVTRQEQAAATLRRPSSVTRTDAAAETPIDQRHASPKREAEHSSSRRVRQRQSSHEHEWTSDQWRAYYRSGATLVPHRIAQADRCVGVVLGRRQCQWPVELD